jgi:hypothetical protein
LSTLLGFTRVRAELSTRSAYSLGIWGHVQDRSGLEKEARFRYGTFAGAKEHGRKHDTRWLTEGFRDIVLRVRMQEPGVSRAFHKAGAGQEGKTVLLSS